MNLPEMDDFASTFEGWSTDYTQLSEEVLSKLVMGDDLFVATSALSELKQRNGNLAKELSLRILQDSIGDKYLQSSAISILIPFHLSDIYDYILQNVNNIDYYIINSILSDMCDEVGVINKDDNDAVKVIRRLCEVIKSLPKGVYEEIMHKFLKYYC